MGESPQTTNKRLGSVKSKNTKPELIVRKFLHKNGFRYRLGKTKLPGKPDLALPKHNAIVFIHGCFWHRHKGCKNAPMPKKNNTFWNEKFKRNIERDKIVQEGLGSLGWRVFVIWECEIDDEHLNILCKNINCHFDSEIIKS